MYIPPAATPANALKSTPLRLGLQGVAGVGKTWSALTFPNPVYCDIDNKLKGYLEQNPSSSFPVLQFWNRDFIVNTCKCSNSEGKDNPKHPPNMRDAFKYWLTEEGSKLTTDQTLIIDSWTSLQTGFDLQSRLQHEVVYSKKTGEVDTFAFWGKKKSYSTEITDLIKRLSCNVILLCHEQYERDDDNKIIGIKVLMDGSFSYELPTQYTDWYRQRFFAEFKDAVAVYPKLTKEAYELSKGYMWQTEKDKYFQNACKSRKGIEFLVPATYESLKISV